jgi:hypothetical protein
MADLQEVDRITLKDDSGVVVCFVLYRYGLRFKIKILVNDNEIEPSNFSSKAPAMSYWNMLKNGVMNEKTDT